LNPIIQTGPSCSLAALCVANGFSQADYEAAKELVEERGKRFRGQKSLRKAIDATIELLTELGAVVPKGYAEKRETGADLLGYSSPFSADDAFSGRGIVWLKGGAFFSHVVAYEDGRLSDTNRTEEEVAERATETWAELVARYRKYHPRTRLVVFKNYKF
jgi:hypothetical protein